jgi:hypothetical protein
LSHERTVRQFVEEINRHLGDGAVRIIYSWLGRGMELHAKWGAQLSLAPYDEEHLLRPAEQQAVLDELSLEALGVSLGLDVPGDSD